MRSEARHRIDQLGRDNQLSTLSRDRNIVSNTSRVATWSLHPTISISCFFHIRRNQLWFRKPCPIKSRSLAGKCDCSRVLELGFYTQKILHAISAKACLIACSCLKEGFRAFAMEHLLLPQGAVVSDQERAPYVAEVYDGGPFLEFTQRSRFKTLYETILPSDKHPSYEPGLEESQAKELEVFLQTWLIFGLLHEVFGETLNQNEFVRKHPDGGRSVLTTEKLPQLVDQWVRENEGHGNTQQGRVLCEHLVICVQSAHRFLTVVRRKSICSHVMIWSVASVSETLESIVLETLEKSSGSLNTSWEQFLDDEEIPNKMVKNGWCPIDVSRWRAALNGFQTHYYLSKLSEPVVKDHSQCTGTACAALQCDMSSHSTAHCCSNEDCEILSIDGEELNASFEDGHFGLLDICGEGDLEGVRFDVKSSKDMYEYIALSHVWADGLGNPFANALPRCQVARVGNILRSFERRAGHGRLMLWLDTLCCPVLSMEHRKRCLVLMRKIYSGANHVLILDAQLSCFSRSSLDSVELAARLIFSTWTRRLWTLQEGILAKRLWMQLRDGAVDFDQILKDVDQIYRTRYIYNPLSLEIVASMKRIRTILKPDSEAHVADIIQVKQALESRSVTVAADEAICLCTCMALDQQRVVDARDENRKGAFWQTMAAVGRKVPSKIIFFVGANLEQPGVRWAPSSFLGQNMFPLLRNPRSSDEVATITQQGLRVKFPGFQCKFKMLTDSEESRWNVVLDDMRDMNFLRSANESWYLFVQLNQAKQLRQQAARDVARGQQGIVEIVQDVPLDEMAPVLEGKNVAALVMGSLAQEENGVLHIRSKTQANLMRWNKNIAYQLEKAKQCSEDPTLVELNVPIPRDPVQQATKTKSKYLLRLPGWHLSTLMDVARQSLSEDAKLLEIAHGASETKDFGLATEGFAEYVLLFLAGRFADVTTTWPKTQQWCID